MERVQREFNRMFGSVFANRLGGQDRWVPAMDLVEEDNDLVLRLDLPGISEQDVDIELQDDVLTVSGERSSESETETDGTYRMERSFGAFSRSLTLPPGIDPDTIRAAFDQGVLEVRIPKPSEQQPRKISVGRRDVEGS